MPDLGPLDLDETRASWDRIAEGWRVQVGDEGDANRRLNSDPVLWRFLGDVRGLRVLDAGCGTGYLSRKLADRGAEVVGIDFAPRMVALARERYPGIDFRVDSCGTLATVGDGEQDAVVANYVLMDTPDLAATMQAFHRVLRPGGHAVLVFSHPCFPQGRAHRSADGKVSYAWEFPYFEPTKLVDPPWAHFTSEFIWFHRPLSAYWKAFQDAGFRIEGFDEPRLSGESRQLGASDREVVKGRTRPYSVAFKLAKP